MIVDLKLEDHTNGLMPITCSNPHCRARDPIRPFTPCVVDTLDVGAIYCPRCGKRLRYHRQKAAERGEKLPKTLQEAMANLADAHAQR